MDLLAKVQDQLRIGLHGLTSDIDSAVALVRPTQDAKHGDYQANCAMSLAKQLGKKPRDVALEIVERVPLEEVFHPLEIAGPGFINFRFREEWLGKRLQEMAGDEHLGISKATSPRTIIIDYSSPNVAKPLHVGHLRSTIIGESLARLFRYLGHQVIADNHLGDWGTQFGMILYGYKNFLDKEAFEKSPVQELARLYKLVRQLMKGEEDADGGKEADPVADAARLETAKLHAGDEENVRLWKMFMPYCLGEIDAIYKRLDVHFDETLGESFYNPMLPDVVEDLLKKGVAQESQSAVAIFFGENDPPALVRKRDGAFTYTTSDLATIKYRRQRWNPNEILYVVDFRQKLHFKNLFEAAGRWGLGGMQLKHISFGSVLGEDRKPLSTREGTGASLQDLLDAAVAEAGTLYEQIRQEAIERGEDVPDFSQDELQALYETVGVGAVKYADLSQNRNSDYVFSLKKMLAMKGNTATYMQYAYVRNRGILRKGEENPKRFQKNPPAVMITNTFERALGMSLLRFQEALQSASLEYQPSAITSYLWDLADNYSSFFVNCPVLKAETMELRDSRLTLCDLTARVIKQGLDLLGIQTPERM